MTFVCIACIALAVIGFVSDMDSGIARQRRRWMRDRYDINPALRRR